LHRHNSVKISNINLQVKLIKRTRVQHAYAHTRINNEEKTHGLALADDD